MDAKSGKTEFVNKIFTEKLGLILSVVSLVCFFGAIVIFFTFGSWEFSSTIDESIIAQFGDFIGGVIGTLLAFVAAILYYVALREQRKDVSINQESARIQNEALIKQIEEFEKQKEELELTRKVYEQQSKTMAEQEKTMRLQQFESNFYSMLNLCISIKNELNEKSNKNNFFKDKYDELSHFAEENLKDESHPVKRHNITVWHYNQLFLLYKGDFSHYFKTIYRIIKIIDSNSFLNEKEKCFYSKIIRSQLSEYELLIMNYNYHSMHASKARNLIYKYNMLKHTYAFSKIEFKCKYNIADKNTAVLTFFHLLGEMLEKNINQFCDSFDIQEQQKKCKYLNCIIKIEYKDDVKVRIICLDKDKLPPLFEKMIFDFLYDKLYIMQFRILLDGIHPLKKEEKDGFIFIDYILNEERIGRINIDK